MIAGGLAFETHPDLGRRLGPLVVLQLGSAALGDRPVGSTTVLFWIVVIAASGCVATSFWLLWRGFVDDSAELA